MKKINALHIYDYVKFVLRTAAFIITFISYVLGRLKKSPKLFNGLEKHSLFWAAIWIVLFIEMLIRFFPSRLHYIGSQKQLKKNYLPKSDAPTPKRKYRGVVAFGIVWVSVNLIFGILYLTEILDAGLMTLLVLAYSVCDMICIVFFCPIRDIFMKNRCCTDCRIYNWDYAMMFTPFIFLPHIYTWSLLSVSLALLAVWEITAARHPERFDEACNASLECRNCTNKPCRHKRRLQRTARRGAKAKELLHK